MRFLLRFIFSCLHVIHIKDKILLKKIGVNLLKIRYEKGFTQQELANIADIRVSQIGRIERGEINSTISTLYKISIALDIDLSILLKNIK